VTWTVVITGGASGIGRALAAHHAQQGWRVRIVDADRDAGPRVADEVGGSWLAADVASLASLERALDGSDLEHGEVDLLVTCAGITRVGAASHLAEDDWRAVIDVDLTGTYLSCRATYPYLRDGGAVVTIGSVASLRAIVGRVAYCAAKAGVVAVTQTLAAEWAQRGIRVNCVAPGWIDTPFLRAAAGRGDVDLEELARRPPLGGLTTVDDVIEAVTYLSSDAARFVTGQTICVDGGWTTCT
jgi:NAD(P)-dependent dehydrogenase (short-subunit alcohol dehydrogenase family)